MPSLSPWLGAAAASPLGSCSPSGELSLAITSPSPASFSSALHRRDPLFISPSLWSAAWFLLLPAANSLFLSFPSTHSSHGRSPRQLSLRPLLLLVGHLADLPSSHQQPWLQPPQLIFSSSSSSSAAAMPTTVAPSGFPLSSTTADPASRSATDQPPFEEKT